MRKLLLPILVFALVLSSCTDDLTSLNKDPKSTTEAPGDPLFTHAQVSLAALQATPNYNISVFKFYAQYWAQTTYNDESSYVLTERAIPSNYWSEIYRDVLKDLDDAAKLVEEDELMPDAEKNNKLAQIEIVKVMAWYKLVTTFGNIPYTKALDSENVSPAYDDAATIYADLLSRLNTAVGNITPGEAAFASQDVIYGGDMAKWAKFANSLRMRLAMTVVDNPPSGVNPQSIVEDASPNAFTSNDDNAIVPFTSTPPHTNPVWEELVQSGRHDFVPANTLVDVMNSLNDPRRGIHFTMYDSDDDGTGDVYKGGVYGAANSYGSFSHMNSLIKLNDFEALIMGYDEVELLRAEAAVRGWSVSGTAASHYNNGIAADMEYWNTALSSYQAAGTAISGADITTFTTADAPFPATGTMEDQMKAIATQKWLALYPFGHQAWTDWRRLNHPTFNLPGSVSSEDEIPVRFIYPVSEQNLNQANWEQAQSAIGGDETSTMLFWDTAPVSSVN